MASRLILYAGQQVLPVLAGTATVLFLYDAFNVPKQFGKSDQWKQREAGDDVIKSSSTLVASTDAVTLKEIHIVPFLGITNVQCQDTLLAEKLELNGSVLGSRFTKNFDEEKKVNDSISNLTQAQVQGSIDVESTEPFAHISSFPNLTRHGEKSLLRKYLTENVFNELKDKQTKRGVQLENIIASGVSLPFGAQPPRGVAGIYVGDAECYQTFAKLLVPIIEEHHKSARGRNRLQRHRTNLSPQLLLRQSLDPKGQYILYTTMRLARSLEGFRFAPCISRAERRFVENLLKECVTDWNKGGYVSVLDMSNAQHDDLIQRRILFPDPDDFAIAAGLGRDWPDGRGLYCDKWDDAPAIVIWCNNENHFSIISIAKGGDVQGVFTRLSEATMALETSLSQRDYAFVEDRQYGFLNTSPANIGTALRASVYVKLPGLSRQAGFFDYISRLNLEARTEYSTSDKRFTGIYDIANAQALGKSEVELINVMIEGVGKLIALEKKLENGDAVDLKLET